MVLLCLLSNILATLNQKLNKSLQTMPQVSQTHKSRKLIKIKKLFKMKKSKFKHSLRQKQQKELRQAYKRVKNCSREMMRRKKRNMKHYFDFNF